MTLLRESKRTAAPDFYINPCFSLIHEDEAILVIDKPAPLAVNGVGVYRDINLHGLLKKDPRWENYKLHLSHRLDAETSGVLLIAKTHEAARFIGKEFMASRVEKKYRALVFGKPAETSGVIGFPLGWDKSSGFQSIRVWDEAAGEEAVTEFSLISTHDHQGQTYSWLQLRPMTGRTHQLRAHVAFLNMPIVGDKIYMDLNLFKEYVLKGISAEMLGRLKLRRLALHAESLSFNHPLTGERMTMESACPDFLKEIAA